MRQRERRDERMLRWVGRGPSCVRPSVWARACREIACVCHGPRPPLPPEAVAGSTALLPTSSGSARCYLFRELVVVRGLLSFGIFVLNNTTPSMHDGACSVLNLHIHVDLRLSVPVVLKVHSNPFISLDNLCLCPFVCLAVPCAQGCRERSDRTALCESHSVRPPTRSPPSLPSLM